MKTRIALLAVLLGLVYWPAHTQSVTAKQPAATEAVAQPAENDDADGESVESVDSDADVVSMPIMYTMTTGAVATSGRVMLSAVDKELAKSLLMQSKAEESAPEVLPLAYALSQNYPNPFNPTTVIQYTLPASGYVTLKVYNMLGQVASTLIDGQQEAGDQSVQWAASNYASGVYFYRITAGTFSDVKRMMLVR